MDEKKNFEIMQKEWREKLQAAFWCMVIICFITEAAVFFLRLHLNRIADDEIMISVIKALILPTFFNIIIAIIVNIVSRSDLSDLKVNRALVYAIMGFSAVIVCFHGYLVWTVCMFSLPIISSVIFTDRLLTRRALTFGVIIMYASIIISWFLDPNFSLAEHLFMGTLNLSFMICVYLISKQVVDFPSQKNDIIRDYDESNEDLHRALTLDPMTSLYNHAEFNRVLEAKSLECNEAGRCMTLVVADIDLFKRVNDNYGHEQGDAVIISIANQLMHICSNKGHAFRYGGEEFAMLFMDQTVSQVFPIMEELRESVSKVSYAFMPKEKITISLGIFEYNGTFPMSPHDIFNCADSALYTAKNTGRNRCCIYNSDSASAANECK